MSKKRNNLRRTFQTPSEKPSEPSQEVSSVEDTPILQEEENVAQTSSEEVVATSETQDALVDETTTSDAVSTEPPNYRKLYELPEAWTDEQVAQWVTWFRAQSPDRAIRTDEYFVYDPTRDPSVRNISDWDTEELILFMMGRFENPDAGVNIQVAKAYRERESVEPAWTDDDLILYYRQHRIPAKTSRGNWVNSRLRQTQQPRQWTDSELLDFQEGFIKATPSATDLHLQHEIQRRQLQVGTSKPTAAQTLDKIEQTAQPTASGQGLTPMNASYIDNMLQRYRDMVAPKKAVSDTEAKRAQQNLEQLFQYVLRLETQPMMQGLERIKRFVQQERDGVFSADYAQRFVHMLSGGIKVQRNHANLIELFRLVTNPNRSVRKQVDVRRMLRDAPDDKREELHEYFTKVA